MIIQNGEVFRLKNGGGFEPLIIKTDGIFIQELTPVTRSDTPMPIVPGQNVEPATDETVIDATGCYVIPGLVDIHFHGCDGYDFCDGTQEALDAICDYELKNGITDICPATMTLPEETLCRVLANAASYHNNHGADLVGIHLEGPFISPAKKGAQNPEHIKAPTAELLDKFIKHSGGLLRLVTIAPERKDALELIEQYKDRLHFSIGHSEADYEVARAAMEAGALHVTHLYNAMPAFTHRAPGIIGAAADTPGCMVELICDGVHIDPAVVRATFKLFGEDNVILISDSSAATGKPDGNYMLGDQPISVIGNLALLADGTTIAGSVTNLFDCMISAVKMGIPLTQAVKAATINPCRSIGMDKELGSIEVGKKAHLLLIDKQDLSLKHIIKGKQYL